MSIALQSIEVRGPRRVRLRYTNTLAMGAFSPSWFSIACLDSSTGDPPVAYAMVVSGAADSVELALSVDLAPGGQYELTSGAGIPAGDASTTALDVSNFRVPLPRQSPSPSVSANFVRALLFGEDLLHEGGDMVETPDGDLATQSGEQNAMDAVVRRALADGLPYNSEYGPRLRRFIDSPGSGGVLRTARGDIERNARLDDRVKAISVDVQPDDNSGDITLSATVTLLGGVRRSFVQRVT